VYTLGLRASLAHVLVPAASVGAELVATNRGGDVTYHGPGQLVGYPILSVPNGPGATPAYVRSVEQLVIDVCTDLGLAAPAASRAFPECGSTPTAPTPARCVPSAYGEAGDAPCTASP